MCKIDALIKKAQKLNMPAVAITDHGNMYGAIEFYTKAKKAGIKPIIGIEVYVAPGSRLERKASGMREAFSHLTLLAENMQGYKNLIKLSSSGFLEGFYYKPRVDKELLRECSEGIIALSGCLKGELSTLVLKGKKKKAEDVLKEYIDIFGEKNFFLEIQNQGIEGQKEINNWLKEKAHQYGLDLIATNDCHYIESNHSYAHEILLCIQTVTNLYDPKRMKFSVDEFWFKDEKAMLDLFPESPEAISNTLKIAERCNVDFDFKVKHLPKYYPDNKQDEKVFLRQLCKDGLKKRYDKVTDEIKERLKREIEIIEKMGYSSYFLIVWDFINYAKRNGVFVGPGRGSAAGSLVSYLLEITDIDPLKYGLLFERFLNLSRVTLPDIDIDFCDRKRDKVIEYVREKYGNSNVAQIITFGTMGAKGVIRDVGRGLGLSYGEVDKVAKLVPDELNISLERALEIEPQLSKLQETDPKIAKLLETALVLEGLVRNASTHAAGIVISEKPLVEHLPLCTGNKGEVITQYPMGPLEQIGMLKMDFLGLKTLSVIQDTLADIETVKGEKIDINKIPLDDDATFELLNKGNTIGVFQVESSGMQDLAKRMGIVNFNELIALIALFRPGPMHMLDDYIERKKGRIRIKYDHPMLEPILKDTYGVMLYQEQVMQCANLIAGFDMTEADILRKIMGKKIVDKMEEQRGRFIAGAKKKGVSSSQSEKIFENMARFAGYGFNKSHSAAYAMISYQTAYLKANYPVMYMAALLTSEMNNTDKLTKYIGEAKKMGIKVLPPEINQSQSQFTVVGDDIRFGLAAIKNVGAAAVNSIVRVRENNGVFESFLDFLERNDSRSVNKKVLESLIKSGAMNSFGCYRRQLSTGLDEAMKFANEKRQQNISKQTSFFDILEESSEEVTFQLPEVEEWSDSELLRYEKELLGFYVTGHPLEEYESILRLYNSASSKQLINLSLITKVRLGGIITSVRKTMTKRDSKKMAIVNLEDLDGSVEVVVFPDTYEKYSQFIEENKPVYVVGQAQAQEQKPKITASEIVPIEEAPMRYANSVQVNIASPIMDDKLLNRLKRIFEQHPGDCNLDMCMGLESGQKILMALNTELKINPDQSCIYSVEELLGKGSMLVKKKT